MCQVPISPLVGLPVQVRDAALQAAQDAPQHAVNREYFAQQNEKKLELGLLPSAADMGPQSAQLMKLARTQPYYQRNKAHVCSFFLKGTCTRGAFCPYLHEHPEEKPVEEGAPDLGKQNIKDRYHGKDDPVALKAR